MGLFKNLKPTVLALILLGLTCQATLEQPIYIPHEDPSKVKEAVSPLWILTYYGDILTLMAGGNYTVALNVLAKMNLTYIPSNIRYIIDRFNSLLNQLNEKLNETDNLLTEASNLINAYRASEAKQKLEEASIALGRANITLVELEDALNELTNRLGVFRFPAGSAVREAYGRITALMLKLKDLWTHYLELLRNLKGEAVKVESLTLKETRLEVWLDRSEAFLGETVGLQGFLTSEEQPLPGRAVTVVLAGSTAYTALTNGSGFFDVELKIPYIYTPTVTVKAVYTPKGGDIGVYKPCESRELSIRLIFYPVELKVKHPAKAYPGRGLEIMGSALTSSGEPVYGVKIKASIVGSEYSTLTDSNGSFRLSIIVSPKLHVGVYKLTVESSPKGLYAPGRYVGSIQIVQSELKLAFKAPTVLVIPSKLTVEGTAYTELGFSRSVKITVSLAGFSNSSKTDLNGSFSASLYIPVSTMLSGVYRLTVEAEPLDPWVQKATVQRRVLIVNPLNIALAIAFSIPILIAILKAFKTRRVEVEAYKPRPVEPTVAGVERPIKPPVALEGEWAPVLKCYLNALDIIYRGFKVAPEPSETLREFAARVEPKLKGLAVYFRGLTHMAEVALYSALKPKPEDYAKAEEFADSLLKALS